MFTVKLDQSRNAPIDLIWCRRCERMNPAFVREEVRLALAILELGFRLIVDFDRKKLMAVVRFSSALQTTEIC